MSTGCSLKDATTPVTGGGKISVPVPVPVSDLDPDLDCPTGTARSADASKETADTCMFDTDGDGTPDSTDVDDDGNGLIEIDSLEKLHNIRYNLIGTSYKTSDDDVGDKTGCGGIGELVKCNGYELTQNLSFDKDNDGTWSGDSTSGYTLDVDDNASPYFVVDAAGNGGWEPIEFFNAIFEGNSHTITDLVIRREKHFVGMFGSIDANAEIRNIDLVDSLVDYISISGDSFIGGLVGAQNGGSITECHVRGTVIGGTEDDSVGGLVGWQAGGSITGSYAIGAVNGGGNVGGLAGLNMVEL